VKLQHQTQVGASPEEVWAFLQDTRAVVQCLPGAELVDELGDDRYEGLLHVAIGPLKMNYAGAVSVIERDPQDRRMTLDASGRDKRGSGAVQAHVQMQVSGADEGSRIDVISDLNLSGRIASLGRGVRDVSNKMFTDFAGNLGARIQAPPPEAAPTPAMSASSSTGPAATTGTARPAPSRTTLSEVAGGSSEIKVMPLVWSITRERVADFLDRLSARVRPR